MTLYRAGGEGWEAGDGKAGGGPFLWRTDWGKGGWGSDVKRTLGIRPQSLRGGGSVMRM